MGALADLPLEIVEQIVSFLAIRDPPSVRSIHEEPSLAHLTSKHCPLKSLSRTCRDLRRLCFTGLFSQLKVNVNCADALPAFVNDNNPGKRVDGVVLYANEETPRSDTNQNYLGYPNPTFAISLNLHLQRAVVSIMDSINPRTLTIIVSPWSFASLVPYQLDLWDSWAFKIQYQTLRLEQDTSDTNIPNTSLTPFDVFSLRPWRHVTYNEGCSVPAYSTYEYFHKCTPSLLGVSPHIQQKPEGWMAHLTSFDFFAIFPFNHIEKVCEFLRQLVHLKYLRTQLAPSAKCGVLDDPAAMGTCQRADLWAEFEIAHRYLLIIIHSFALQSLIEYTALDYTTPELRSVIDRVDEHELFNKSWCHDGNGKWTRN